MMMENRRMRLIAELMKHLEDLDGEDLKSGMNPKPMIPTGEPDGDEMDGVSAIAPEVASGSEKGPMEKLVEKAGGDAEGGDPKPVPSEDDDEEMSDEELEEMMKM